MWCLARPRRRGSVHCNCSAYHTSIVSTPTRASTHSPINRDGTEYTLRCTPIVLPWPTFTRKRSTLSRRRTGNTASFAISSTRRWRRPPFRRSCTVRNNAS
jgi:hypothetical protein